MSEMPVTPENAGLVCLLAWWAHVTAAGYLVGA